MESALFEDLLQSLKEAKAIVKGEAQPSRIFKASVPDAKAIRKKTGLSQSEFAKLTRVSLKTIQNWEQHRRNPTGAAAALLIMVEKNPIYALQTLHIHDTSLGSKQLDHSPKVGRKKRPKQALKKSA
jgi:putative transcriptional regulator